MRSARVVSMVTSTTLGWRGATVWAGAEALAVA